MVGALAHVSWPERESTEVQYHRSVVGENRLSLRLRDTLIVNTETRTFQRHMLFHIRTHLVILLVSSWTWRRTLTALQRAKRWCEALITGSTGQATIRPDFTGVLVYFCSNGLNHKPKKSSWTSNNYVKTLPFHFVTWRKKDLIKASRK